MAASCAPHASTLHAASGSPPRNPRYNIPCRSRPRSCVGIPVSGCQCRSGCASSNPLGIFQGSDSATGSTCPPLSSGMSRIAQKTTRSHFPPVHAGPAAFPSIARTRNESARSRTRSIKHTGYKLLGACSTHPCCSIEGGGRGQRDYLSVECRACTHAASSRECAWPRTCGRHRCADHALLEVVQRRPAPARD